MSKIQVNLDELQNFAIELGKAANECDQALGHINVDLYSLFANVPGVANRQINELEKIFRNNLKKYKNRLDDSQRLIRMTVAKMNETEMLLAREAAELSRDHAGYYANLGMFYGSTGNYSGEAALTGEFTSVEDISCKRPNSSDLTDDSAWYDVVGNAILGVRDGVVKAVIDIFEGLLGLFEALTTDPLGFFKGIGNAVLHPVDTLNYMWGAVETAWERDVVNGNARSRGEFFSYALVSIVGLKGTDKVMKVGKVNKVGKVGAKVDGNTSLSSAANMLISNSLMPIPFNVLQTVKLKELVKHNVVSAFSKGSQWTKDFFKNDLAQKALKQGVVAISNAKTLSKIRNVVNPTAFNSFFKNTFNDVIKGPLAKTKVAIDQQLRKVVEGIGKVEVPTRIRGKILDAYGIKIPVVDLGITTMKDVVQKISGSKSEKDSSVITDGIGKDLSKKSRNKPGVVNESFKLDRSFQTQTKLMYSKGAIGVIPKEIRDKLIGKQFNSFDYFRKEFWKSVANSSFATEFNIRNISRMLEGNAPIAPKIEHYGKHKSYILHHKQPIDKGGEVYNLDNLMINSPKMHQNILDPAYHFGKKGQ